MFVGYIEEIVNQSPKMSTVSEKKYTEFTKKLVGTLLITSILYFKGSLKRALQFLTFVLGYCVYRNRAPKIVNKKSMISKNGPKHYPILGCVIETGPPALDSFVKYIIKLSKITDFSSSEFASFGSIRGLVLHDERDRKYLLKDNFSNYVKNLPGIVGFQEIFSELMGRGIFAVDSEEWKVHRKISSHMFSTRSLNEHMKNVFIRHSIKLVNVLNNNKGKQLDLQEVFQAFTFDTICEIAFGHSSDSLVSLFENKKRDQFLISFDRAQQITASRLIGPPFIWYISKFFKLGKERELTKHIEYINEYVNNIINGRKAEESTKLEDQKDLLSLYIDYAEKHYKPEMLENYYLRDVIINFMIAGRDTTSCTLTNWIKLVSQNSDIQEKLSDEYEYIYSNSKNCDILESDLNSKFLDSTFNEVIRLYPPVAIDIRYSLNDDVLPSGLIVPNNTRCIIPNIAIGRNPKYFENPESFIPERWISEERFTEDGFFVDTESMLREKDLFIPISEKVTRPEEYKFPVFWGGPRLCLGKDMARLEVKIVTYFLRDLKFEILEHREHWINGPVMFYTDGLPVIIK
jgi:cytochrome P450